MLLLPGLAGGGENGGGDGSAHAGGGRDGEGGAGGVRTERRLSTRTPRRSVEPEARASRRRSCRVPPRLVGRAPAGTRTVMLATTLAVSRAMVAQMLTWLAVRPSRAAILSAMACSASALYSARPPLPRKLARTVGREVGGW